MKKLTLPASGLCRSWRTVFPCCLYRARRPARPRRGRADGRRRPCAHGLRRRGADRAGAALPRAGLRRSLWVLLAAAVVFLVFYGLAQQTPSVPMSTVQQATHYVRGRVVEVTDNAWQGQPGL